MASGNLKNHRIQSLQFTAQLPKGASSFAEIATKADKSLFWSIITDPGHVLNHHLPKVKTK